LTREMVDGGVVREGEGAMGDGAVGSAAIWRPETRAENGPRGGGGIRDWLIGNGTEIRS
jgi:hypothetical protein